MFWLFQTMEFSVLPFQQIVDFVFPVNIGVLQFGFSKHWNSVFLLFKDWNPMLLLFQTLEFWILAFPDIEMQCFAFRKHSNSRILPFQTLLSISVFCLIQTSQFWILPFSTLEFTVLAVPNIGLIVDFVGFSKHWSSIF